MEKQPSTAKDININFHSDKQFSEVLQHGLVHGGIHTVASKGHGKSRLLFSMAKHLRNLSNCRVLIFDGSETWLYAFDRIPVVSISERDITLSSEVNTTEDLERYELENWNLIKLALSTEKDVLFRLKSRKPSKRGFAVRTIINHLDALQRKERATAPNNEAKNYIAYFIEEAQDSFNSRSTTRLEAEEFLTVFNEARNQKESFFTASQRLNDFSKTIRTKQAYCIGAINYEDKTSFLRRLEKQHQIDFSELNLQTWFFNGKTFKSPWWKQKRKPYIINGKLKHKFIESMKQQPQPQQKPKKLYQKILDILSPSVIPQLPQQHSNSKSNKATSENFLEDSEFDKRMEEEDEEDIEFLEDW